MSLRDFVEPIVPTMQTKLEAGSTGASYTTSALAFLGGAWSKNELMALIGLVFVAATYFTSLYFQRRRERREQELHRHRIEIEMNRAEKAEDRAEIKSWQSASEDTQ